MEKTYNIILTINVPNGLAGKPYTETSRWPGTSPLTIKEAIYSYLYELMEDDSLYYEELNTNDNPNV